MTMETLAPTSDDRIIWDAWLSVYRLPVITVADEIGIFERLSEGPMTSDALANAIGADARALGVHLGVLAAMDFVERRGGLWRATAVTRMWLHPAAEGYCGPALHGFRESQPLHSQLLTSLKTGRVPSGHISAAEEWERGEMPVHLAKVITAYMNAHSRAAAKAVASQGMFSQVQSLLDVGGGSAIFSIELARSHAHLQATVMDIDAICREADAYILAAAAGPRVRTQAVDMFRQDWPSGHDVHFLSNIFHDWSEATCRLLARKSFHSLPSGGRIVLHEMLMNDDGCGPLAAAAFSLLMLLGTRGRQYSHPELMEILASAGFVDVESFRTGAGYYSLVIARKP